MEGSVKVTVNPCKSGCFSLFVDLVRDRSQTALVESHYLGTLTTTALEDDGVKCDASLHLSV